MKLTRKFTFALIAGVLLIQVGFAALRVHRLQSLFEVDIMREERVLGRALVMSTEAIAAASGDDHARELLEEVNQRDDHVNIRWIPLDDAEAATAGRIDAARLAALRRGEHVDLRQREPEPAVFSYTPLNLAAGRTAAIEISDSLRDENAYLRASMRNAALSTMLLVALCGLVGWIVGLFFIGRPLRALVAQARRVAAGDLSGRIELAQRDELRELADEMNDMCSALGRARERVASETKAKIDALAQLKHADRLRTVGTLASGIAHELGTPLNVVEGHAQLIREEPTLSDNARESALVIGRQAKRMTAIIRQLLDFARREQRGTGTADPLATARDAIDMAAPLAKKRGVDISLQNECDGAHAAIPREELTQVLVNVIINGVQAMPEGGALSVRLSRAHAAPPWSSHETRDVLCIGVDDHGEGMRPEDAERVFEPFFTTKDVGEGTGLGLSVAYGIVSEHDGWIDVSSAPGEGTRFSIHLPLSEAT